ncbi:MAG: YHS domain-containing protein [Gemmatimonadales bacterium]
MERNAVQDPVCGMTFERGDAVASSEQGNRTYYFCSETCRRAFEADPTAFLDEQARRDAKETVRLPLLGVACAAGDRLPLEKALRRVPGVLEAYVNPVDEAAYLTVEPTSFVLEDALAAVDRLGAKTPPPFRRGPHS